MKKYLFTVLALTATLTSSVAQASASTEDTSDYSFLYPGFHMLIQPGAEGGQSISALYDGDGFILCYSQVNPSNEAITAPFHCNSRITPAGYHIPAKILFGRTGFKEKLKTIGKFLAVAVPMGAQAFPQLSAASDASLAATNLVGGASQSPGQQILENYQLSKTMDQIKLYAKKGEQDCSATAPTAPAPFFMADVLKDIQDRVRDFQKKCKSYPVALSPDEKDPDKLYCHEQNQNQLMAANIMSFCNIESVTAQAGETGNAELWFPGEPVLKSCVDSLKQYGQKDSSGNPILGADGWNVVPMGAPMVAWLKKEQDQLKGLSPTSSGDAVAQHGEIAESCGFEI
jgi:hypothetical protein